MAKSFYNEFLPEAEALKPGITEKVMASEFHKWKKGLTPAELQRILDFYKEHYKQ